LIYQERNKWHTLEEEFVMSSLKNLVFILVGGAVVGCSSNQIPGEKMQAPQSAPLVQRNFIIRDRSHAEPPLWSYDFMTYSAQTQQGQERFFVAESGDVNDKIAGCDLAKGRAREEIALEMATFITSKMANTSEGQAVINKMDGGNGSLEHKFKKGITQEAVGLLAGVQVVSTEWEERDYTQAGGANSVFSCKALIKINKKTLEEVVKKTAKKAIEQAPASDQGNLSKALAEAPKQFVNNTSPSNL
jgi:hypothetical protein